MEYEEAKIGMEVKSWLSGLRGVITRKWSVWVFRYIWVRDKKGVSHKVVPFWFDPAK